MRWYWLATMLVFAVPMLPGLAMAQEEEEPTEEEGEETEEAAESEEGDGEEEDDSGPPSELDEAEDLEDDEMEEDDFDEACRPEDFKELALLADLKKRDDELQKREKLLEEKEAVLARVDDELKQKMTKMLERIQTMEKVLELGKEERRARDERFQKLVDTIKTLSARKAAPILEQADMRFATRLMRGLGPKLIGKLLAAMPPGRAALLMGRLEKGRNVAQSAAAKAK